MIGSTQNLLAFFRIFSAMLCMVAMMSVGLASAHARLSVYEHQAADDALVGDGGWEVSCAGASDVCGGHAAPAEDPTHDGLGFHHHHHNSTDTASGLIPDVLIPMTRLHLSRLNLRPDTSVPLVDLSANIPHQPPRT